MKVKIKVYDKCKYLADSQKVNEVTYNNVYRFEVVAEERAKEIESLTDSSCIDDYHEYLVIYHTTHDTSTFRNSYVDLFIEH